MKKKKHHTMAQNNNNIRKEISKKLSRMTMTLGQFSYTLFSKNI